MRLRVVKVAGTLPKADRLPPEKCILRRALPAGISISHSVSPYTAYVLALRFVSLIADVCMFLFIFSYYFIVDYSLSKVYLTFHLCPCGHRLEITSCRHLRTPQLPGACTLRYAGAIACQIEYVAGRHLGRFFCRFPDSE